MPLESSVFVRYFLVEQSHSFLRRRVLLNITNEAPLQFVHGDIRVGLSSNYKRLLSQAQGHDLLMEKEAMKPRNAPKFLRAHIVLHSHVDPGSLSKRTIGLGWLKTLSEYYRQDVEKILSLAVEFLSRNERLKFIWSEVVFLEMWWKEATQSQRHEFKRPVIL